MKKSIVLSLIFLLLIAIGAIASERVATYNRIMKVESMNITDGNLDVSGGDINNANRIFSNNITSDEAVIALEFIDLTPAYNGTKEQRKEEILRISSYTDREGNQVINHSSLPDFVKKTATIRNKTTGEKYTVEGRGIGNLLTMSVNMIQEQQRDIDNLKIALCQIDSRHQFCT